MAKQTNNQYFELNGKTFKCYTTETRSGFCHHVLVDGVHTRVSYINRTWESFRYESALLKAIEKFPKCERKEFEDAVEAHSKKHSEEVEKAFAPALAIAEIIGKMR